jgi:hypothetical protein
MISFPLSFCFPVWRHCVFFFFPPGVERISVHPYSVVALGNKHDSR